MGWGHLCGVWEGLRVPWVPTVCQCCRGGAQEPHGRNVLHAAPEERFAECNNNRGLWGVLNHYLMK